MKDTNNIQITTLGMLVRGLQLNLRNLLNLYNLVLFSHLHP